MKNESENELILSLVSLGYGRLKRSQVILDREKIKNKIEKELEPVEVYKTVCDEYKTEEDVLFKIIEFSMAKKAPDIFDFIKHPEKMLTREGFELFTFLKLFYNISKPECDGEYHRFRLLDDIDLLINKYEKIRVIIEKDGMMLNLNNII